MAYQPFEVDSSWSWEKQKKEYKKAANAFKKNNPDATLKDFYTANGQLIQPDGTGLQLKPKAKTTSPNYPDYQPKIKATTDVEINKRKIAEEALDTKTAKAWKKKNITDWNLKDNPTGKPITDSHPEFRRFEHRIKVSDNFWKSNDALDLGFKAGDVENLTYTNPAQWKLKDAGEMRYGQYFNFDVDDFGQVTYTPRSKFHPFELNDTTAFKGEIPLKELAEEAGAAYTKFGINPKRALFSTLRNPYVKGVLGSVAFAGLALDVDAAQQDWSKYKSDTNGDNLANAIGSTAIAIDQISPFGIVGQTVNYAVRNGNNGDKANGSLGLNGLADGIKKAETYEKEESELTNGWYEDSLEDRQLNGSRYTKRLLKAI